MNRITIPARVILIVFSTLLSCLTAPKGFAQTGEDASGLSSLKVVDWEVSSGAAWIDIPDATMQFGRFGGRVPLESLLPQTTADSRIDFLTVSAGRFSPSADGPSDRTAWQATVLDLALQRASWSGSVSLVDLSSRVFPKEQNTWFEAGTGPGLHHRTERMSISARAQVFGGIQSTSLEMTDGSDRKGSGFHGGVRVSAAMAWDRLSFNAEWGRSEYSNGELSLSRARVTLSTRVADRWRLAGIMDRLTDVGTTSEASTRVGLLMMYRLNNR